MPLHHGNVETIAAGETVLLVETDRKLLFGDWGKWGGSREVVEGGGEVAGNWRRLEKHFSGRGAGGRARCAATAARTGCTGADPEQAPESRWDVMRELRRRIKNRFDDEGIEIPFPHRTLYVGKGDGGVLEVDLTEAGMPQRSSETT